MAFRHVLTQILGDMASCEGQASVRDKDGAWRQQGRLIADNLGDEELDCYDVEVDDPLEEPPMAQLPPEVPAPHT